MKSPIDFSLQYKTSDYRNYYAAFLSPRCSVIDHLMLNCLLSHKQLHSCKESTVADLLPNNYNFSLLFKKFAMSNCLKV